MRHLATFRNLLLAGCAAMTISACTQGEEIRSPGPSNPGTPPGGNPGDPGDPGAADCPTGFTEGASVGGLTTCNISGTLLGDFELPYVDGVAYRLEGRVNVGEDGGVDCTAGSRGTLRIEPGVVVFGSSGQDFILVNRCSQIIADGDQNAPIVFTSANDLARRAANPNDFGGNNIGEWGGLVVLGRAPTNRCISGTPATADCETLIEGVTAPEAVYGGDVVADNSGILRYVQVNFAGFEIAPGNELNGLTLGGVGNGTTVEYVQVHNGSDDGIEVFGGAVNLKYIVLTGNDDDSFDLDNGWDGFTQYLVIKQREGADNGDNGFELSSVAGVSPATNPTIANFTLIGGQTNGWRINTGFIGRFINGVVNYSGNCFRWEASAGDGTPGAYGGVDVDPTFNSVLFDCAGELTNDTPDTPAAVASIAADANNVIGLNSLAANFFPGPNEDAVTPFDFSSLGGAASVFFDDVDYIGAFAPTESETNNWAIGWTLGLFPEPSCPVGTTDTNTAIGGVRVCSLSGTVTSDLRLVRGNYYELNGRVSIGVDVGADGAAPGGDPTELTIESGVTLFGASGNDFLLVNRGSKIFANGTRDNPIIFTSEADVRGTQADPANAIGEWGGLVVLGRAPTNRCISGTPATIDCETLIEGVTAPEAVYGGVMTDDNSGSLRYVQLKYAGFEIAPGNELNGLTLGGVGSGTTIEYFQVHNGSDDGIEIFGGAVNLKYIVLTGNDDDNFDLDNGWDGFAQYLINIQRSTGGDNSFELSSVAGVTPATNPTIANFTVVGQNTNAWRINTGFIGRFINGVVDYTGNCFRFEGSAGDGSAGAYGGVDVDPTFNSVLFDCSGELTNDTPDTPAVVASIAADANNEIGASSLISTFVNGANEDLVTPFDFSTLSVEAQAFFDQVDYVGAVKDANDRWWAGWSCGLEAGSDC